MNSLIVIGVNEAKNLKRCFDSIHKFAQFNEIEYEIIFVDSSSIDNSIEIANQCNLNRILILEKEKRNAAKGRNLGAKHANGDIFCFLDGDMELIPEFGKQILNEKKELIYPFITGVYINYYHDTDGTYTGENNYNQLINSLDNSKYLMDKIGGNFFLDRSLWDNLKGMNEKYVVNEDIELCYRSYLNYKIKPLLIYSHLSNHYTINYLNNKRRVNTALSNGLYSKGMLIRNYLFTGYGKSIVRANIQLITLAISILMIPFFIYSFMLYFFITLIFGCKKKVRNNNDINIVRGAK